MSDFPMLRIQLEGLGQRFAAMVDTHSDELKRIVEKGFVEFVESGGVEREVNRQIAQMFPKIIERALNQWEVQDAMAKHLAAMLIPEKAKD